MARLHTVSKHWWMRGLKNEEKIVASEKMTAVQNFKKRLRWGKSETWFDQDGVGLLFYAVSSDEGNVCVYQYSQRNTDLLTVDIEWW